MATKSAAHPYEGLTPDTVLDAVESTGVLSDQRFLALNSYENRVYQVGVEDGQPIIVKFYRPERWTNEAILEEHAFTRHLLEADISVVAPMEHAGKTLHEHAGFRFAMFPRQGGYAPEIDQADTLYRIGLNVGRIHQAAGLNKFQHRVSYSVEKWGCDARLQLLNSGFLPESLRAAYDTLTRDILEKIQGIWDTIEYYPRKLHGDCHLGNILWRNELAHFVDFDDCCNGPAIQDLWLMLSGDRAQQSAQLAELVEGYEEFCEFDIKQLALIESLRTLRIMHYAAWLAKRWSDPAFPMYFTWFNTEKYWAEHILELREQFALLDEPALKLFP